jgi:hypothetical protein
MPLIYEDLTFTTYKSGGTLQVTGNVDVSSGLEIELSALVFNARGVWTLITWSGSLTGSAANVTLVAGTGMTLNVPSRPFLDGNSFKVVLS